MRQNLSYFTFRFKEISKFQKYLQKLPPIFPLGSRKSQNFRNLLTPSRISLTFSTQNYFTVKKTGTLIQKKNSRRNKERVKTG